MAKKSATPMPAKGLGSDITKARRRASAQARRDAERMASEEADHARRSLYANRSLGASESFKAASAVLHSTINNQTALLRGWGIDAPVTGEVSWTTNPECWTDFRKVVVKLPLSSFGGSRYGEDKENAVTYETISAAVATVKGALQHEFGHLRFTVPFGTLAKGRDRGTHQPRDLQMIWNMIEDQRMEQRVVRAVPRIASYFTQMVGKLVLLGGINDRAWEFVACRDYLPAEVRDAARDAYAGDAAEIERRIRAYCNAETMDDMWDALMSVAEMVSPQPRRGVDTHVDPERNGGEFDEDEAERRMERARVPADDDADDDAEGDDDGTDADGEGGEGSDIDGDTDDEAEGDNSGDTAGNSDAESEGDSDDDAESQDDSQGVGSGDGEKSIIEDMIKQAEEEIAADSDIDTITKQVMGTLSGEGTGSKMPVYAGAKVEFTDDRREACEAQALQMASGFNELLAARAPHWVVGQEHGVLDALRFRTHRPGERDFYTDLEGEVVDTLDTHLSVLVDNSGSMIGDRMAQACEAMFVLARSAEMLNMPADFLLWNSGHGSTQRVHVDGAEPVHYEVGGGTSPGEAITDSLDHASEDAAHHLVVIVTDGQWHPEDYQRLRMDRTDRTKYLLVCVGGGFYGDDDSAMMADAVIHVPKLDTLASQVESALHAMMD